MRSALRPICWYRPVALTALLLPSIACSSDSGVSGETPGVTVRDSAGVEIVENVMPQLAEPESWRLTEDPVYEIGTVEGGSIQSLFRVTDAKMRSDGRVVVLNAGTPDVRVIDPATGDGFVVGGEGEGPGEYGSPTALSILPGDSLLLFDRSSNRVSVFGPDGEFVASTTIQIEGVRSGVIGGGFDYLTRRPDGSHLTLAYQATEDSVLIAAGVTTAQNVVLVDPDVRSSRVLFERRAGDGIVGAGLMRGVPFPRASPLIRVADGFVTGFAATLGYERRDSLGALIQAVRVLRDPQPVTEADREAWIADALEPLSEVPEAVRGNFEANILAQEFPPTHPLFDRMLVGTDDVVWIRHPTPEGSSDPERWSAFTPDGIWASDVLVPNGLFVREFGADHVLGVARDELDIEYVRVYGLEKPGRQESRPSAPPQHPALARGSFRGVGCPSAQ